ncbi:MAG: class I SAM-dependent RNA methyltransferase [Alphaproteobacteria bacterium]|nr:class I SAM-dependent RNA methyltransferase [Alphaproteobacteria bacterium]
MKTCIHFGTCGGCSLQDLAPANYAAGKRAMMQNALMKAGVTAEVLAPVIVSPRSRRRAVFKLAKGAIGFHAARSHSIVDMRECLVLTSGLFELAQQLRTRLAFLKEPAEVHVTETLTGFDLAVRSPQKLSPALNALMAEALAGLDIARAVFNNALVLESAPPQVEEGGVRVTLPPQAFLQSTREGEAALQERVLGIVGKAKTVCDLFAGLGTFALPLAKKARVHAVEQDAPALAALATAARGEKGLKPVTTEQRDLFKLPLTPVELAPYNAVVLDPPRAGAEAQARALARSKVPIIAYVSCDAATFARDAALLLAGGYRLGPVSPIDQFLWSSHIELVAGFKRAGA